MQGWNPCKNPTRKYYYAGAQRIAMRENGTLYYLLADHLGSTSITANSSGVKVAELRYKAWGEERYSWGTTPTTYRYTGQRAESGIGLYYYGARWYDASLARFTQPDTIVPDPGDPQSWNRFSYVENNPLRYKDPTGHRVERSVQGEQATKRGRDDDDGSYTPEKTNSAAMAIVLGWFWEIGPEQWEIGPSSALTLAVQHDVGVGQARQTFRRAGCPSSSPSYPYQYNIQHTSGGGWASLVRENMQLVRSLMGLGSPTPEGSDNPVGAVLGSYRVEISNPENGALLFQVFNRTGRESFLRIPDIGPVMSDRDRSETGWGEVGPAVTALVNPLLLLVPPGAGGWGGAITEQFWWWEPNPCDYKGR